MGASAEELRTEIAGTRSDLSETLDAIGDRVSPGRVIERRKNRMTNGWRGVRDRVLGTVHEAAGSLDDTPDAVRARTEGAPMIAGALAFGVGFLVAAAIPASEREKQLAPQLQDKIEPIKQELADAGRELGEQLTEPAKESLEAVKEAASDGAQHVAEDAKSAAAETKTKATEAVDRVKTTGDGNVTSP